MNLVFFYISYLLGAGMETEAEGIEWKGSWFSFFLKDFYRKFFQIYATIMNGGGG